MSNCCGIFFISLATLTYEVSLTRIFSITQGYHFAFMVISIGLLGVGASGSVLTLFPSMTKKKLTDTLFATSLIFSTVVLSSYLLFNLIPFDSMKISWDKTQLLYIMYYYILLSLPFFFTGLTISIAITHLHQQVNKIYFADLTGAALGSLVALLVFYGNGEIGAIGTVFLLGILSSLSFGIQCTKKRLLLFPCGLTTIFLILLASYNHLFRINLSPYRGLKIALRYPGASLLSTRWNSFSRVDVVKSPAARYAPGLSLNFQGSLPPQLGIAIDGDNLNAITHYKGTRENLSFLTQLPSSLPYYLQTMEEVLVLEPKGGLDVLMALYFGAHHIEGVELNPLVLEAVNEECKEFSGALYRQKGVTITNADIRSFLRKTNHLYDLIQFSLSNVLGASSSGVYGLVEDYCFTEEAFHQYLSHLKKGGIFAITSYLLPPPRSELRVISQLISVLEQQNLSSPERCLVVIRSWGTLTTLCKRGYFTKGEIKKVKQFCEDRQFDLDYYPGITPEEANRYNQMPEPLYYQLVTQLLATESREQLYQEYLFDLTPVTDDKPFFYHFFKLKQLKKVYHSVGGKWQFLIEGVYLIPIIFVQAFLASLFFIFLPTLLAKKAEIKTISCLQKTKILSYFFWVGTGFMFVEIPLIQKCILFLDHPYYATALVISALLLATGMGSYCSRTITCARGGNTIIAILAILPLFLVFFNLLLPPLFHFLLLYPLWIRKVATFLVLFPLGMLMGIPFPLGIRWVSQLSPSLIPWAWCVNGCSSVLSSILAVLIALGGGFTLVLHLAAGCYSLAAFTILKKNHPLQPTPSLGSPLTEGEN